MNSRQTALAFVEAVNSHRIDRISALMANDHVFIDAYGGSANRDQMMVGWPGYFDWFPDYLIEVTDIFAQDSTVALMGYASGTFRGKPGSGHWKLPAAWKVEAQDGKVSLWQVFCDSKIPYEIINGVEE